MTSLIRNHRLLIATSAASLAVLSVQPAAIAADFTVQNGQTVGQQSLDTPGDTGTIEAGGTINDGGDGVVDTGTVDDLTVINNGTINAGSDGIDIDGDRATITNNGTITSGDDGIEGDDNNTIINNGTINAAAGDDGINVDNDNTITNTGTILADDEGVEMDNNNTLINSGTIQSDGSGEAVEANNNNIIINSGTIISTGNNEGIDAGNDTTIINTGSIISQGDEAIDTRRGTIINSGLIQGDEGIDNNGGSLSVTNSGTIIGTGGDAIIFRGGADTLSLLPGSNIQGTINFGGGTDTLIVGNGMSIANTFVNLPEIINTNGAPFVVAGTQIAVLDPTVLGQADEMLADLSSGIFNSIHARLNGASGGPSNQFAGFGLGASSMMQLGGGSMMNLSSKDVTPEATADRRSAFWVQAFGGVRDEEADGPSTASSHELIGGIAGLDGMVMPGVRLGGFAGGAHAELETTFGAQDLDTDSFFGGGYVSVQRNAWFTHVMLTAGKSDHDSSRQVANNLAAGGIQTATASFDGTFISPEVTVGTTMNLGGITIEPSIRGRYAYLSLDGYTETGAADALTVGDRDISLWQGRAQIAFPMASDEGAFSPRIGIEAWSSNNDDVSAVLLGQAVSFDPGGDDDQFTAFVGATASTSLGSGVNAFIDGEVHLGDDGFARSEARAGIKVRF